MIAEAVISIARTLQNLISVSGVPNRLKQAIGATQTSALTMAPFVCALTSSCEILRRSASTSEASMRWP